jgi:peroxiredoxin
MKRTIILVAGLLIMFLAIARTAETRSAKLDHAAPDFTLIDSNGMNHSLSEHRGKYVVLEWVNYDCPFVRKHYSSGNMQKLQKVYTDKGVVWFSICSSAEGRQGYFETEELKERMTKQKAVPTAYLIDEDGTVGKTYDAKATPHMFVINPEGVLIYAGAIDDIASTNLDDIGKAKNYVKTVMEAAMNGKAVPVKGTTAYGCSIKYK